MSYLFICVTMALICGCSHFSEEYKARPTFAEANKLFTQGSYPTALGKYKQIKAQYPTMGDRALFEMGIIHGHPQNEQKDYAKALECFQQLVRDYPASGYRQDSEMMIFYINNVTLKDRTIATQQGQNEALRQEVVVLQQQVKDKENETVLLQKTIEGLEQKISALTMQKVTADRILIEKKQRRLTLFSKGEAIKTYRIALGGNPEGRKERLGDNKTPEGLYIIDSRNRDSRYHLALHVSYPNERDKRRAKELGVDPGGNIMIHGLKNGFSYVGELHTKADWTKGCIAVTDEEIAEIARAVPNGTVVEIRP